MKRYQTTALQNDAEFARFIEILRGENVRSYLEIGSKFGGSLWKVANALPIGSRIVSVDLPWGNRETEPDLKDCMRELRCRGYNTHLFLHDSTREEVVEQVRGLGPFDVCFIDANHLLPYVTKDWNNYGPMARIVAFHDIGWLAHKDRKSKVPIEVPQFWASIKDGYRHEEIKLDARDNGIGVLWRQ